MVCRDHNEGPDSPPVRPEPDACAACGTGHDDVRQAIVLWLRRQVAVGAYQPPVAKLVDRLVTIVARRSGRGPGLG